MQDFLEYIHKKKGKIKSYYKRYGLLQTVKGIFSDFFLNLLFYPSRNLFYLTRSAIRKLSLPVRIILFPIIVLFRFWYFIITFPAWTKQKINYLLVTLHTGFFGFFCANSYLLRKWFKPKIMADNNKKNVLHVIASFDLGGTQRQVMNLCEKSSDGDFIHQTIEIFPELNYMYRKGVILDRDRYVTGNIFTRMLGKWTLNFSHRSHQMLQVYKLVRDFKALNPDIVVGWGHEIAMLSFIAASIARIPGTAFCIRTFNPSFGWTDIGHILEKAHREIIPFLNAIIVNSTPLRNDYSAWMNIPKDNIRVCPNGIEPYSLNTDEQFSHRMDIRRLYSIPGDAIVIVHIGRFTREKGQMLLVRAYRKVIERYPSKKIYCLLCGDGPLQSAVKNYTIKHLLTNALFAGRVDNIHSYLCAGDIFVMPSDFEGMPNAMMEAMAHGLPCVSTNRSGALDIARDNLEALYIDVGSEEQLAEKLCCLIEQPDERRRLGENARERLKDFSIAKMVTTFNGHMEEIVKKFDNAE